MNITAHSLLVMGLNYDRINGQAGLGIYRLHIIFNYILRTCEKKFTTRNGSLLVYLKDNKSQDHYLGTAQPKKPFYFNTPEKDSQDGRLTFILDLTGRQLELIEKKWPEFKI